MRKLSQAQVIMIRYIILIFIILIIIYSSISMISKSYYNQYSVVKLFFIYTSGNNIDSLYNIDIIYVLLTFARLFEIVALAILSSFAFSFILNKQVKLVFPDKLILRWRTSEGSDGKLSLGVLVGNPGKYDLYDVECCINCFYVKEKGDILKRNGEVILIQKIKALRNYYRFSFDVAKLHKQFWIDYLSGDRISRSEDYISVTISGRANTLGGTFIQERRYRLTDIDVDLRNPENDFKKVVKSRFLNRTISFIDWRQFSRFERANEADRKTVIDEITRYAYSNRS